MDGFIPSRSVDGGIRKKVKLCWIIQWKNTYPGVADLALLSLERGFSVFPGKSGFSNFFLLLSKGNEDLPFPPKRNHDHHISLKLGSEPQLRQSHGFGTINDLTRLDLVDGLPKFKYGKDHLCSACERGKSKKASHPPKLVPNDHSKLELLHIDLCGPMRVASINGKKYILVMVDDYSRYTWVYFLHSKDETLEIIKKFIAQGQLNCKAKVCKIRTDNGTEFENATLKAHYEKIGIMQ
ncbi:retrovirus-related pol polyprotein from transposon TNT 1-94 [Tanacetum coccineum]|uniref:Retrovirus-related pol polyprotein from transposon TNT 1-94 n=1 Tax=Tanacetum coccineum TaxID=301880 RepID=A0ABQ4X127_9ASTR